MNTVSNLLVFTCNHTSCCCSQHCSTQAGQQPHFKSDKFFQTAFFPLWFRVSQAGEGYLRRRGWLGHRPAVPCSQDKPAGASSLAMPMGMWHRGRPCPLAAETPSWKLSHLATPPCAAWRCPGAGRCSDETPELPRGSAPPWGVLCFSFKQCLLFLHPQKRQPVMNLVHSCNTMGLSAGGQRRFLIPSCDFAAKNAVLVAEAQI